MQFDLHASFSCSIQIYANDVFFSIRCELHWVQPCRFALYPRQAEKGWLVEYLALCHTFRLSLWRHWHKLPAPVWQHIMVMFWQLSNTDFLTNGTRNRVKSCCTRFISYSTPISRVWDVSSVQFPFKKSSLWMKFCFTCQLLWGWPQVACADDSLSVWQGCGQMHPLTGANEWCEELRCHVIWQNIYCLLPQLPFKPCIERMWRLVI